MHKHLPNCPQAHCNEIIWRVVERTWQDATIGRAVGITVTNYVRHRLTDYEKLMTQYGLTREEARIAEAGTVQDILRSWQTPAAQDQVRIKLIGNWSENAPDPDEA